MQQITASKKFQNGIQVFWTDKGTDLNDFFSYEDLIDQKINAFDLLNNPRIYQMNAASHKIESLVAGAVLQQRPARTRSSSPVSSMHHGSCLAGVDRA